MIPMLGFEIRQATEADIPSIQQITREAFEKYRELAGLPSIAALNETHEDIASDIKNKIVLVAFENDEPVGSLRIEIKDEGIAYLSRFGVRLNHQNNGIGKALMNVVDVSMRAAGIKQLQLHTASKIFPLIRFYYGRSFYIDSTTKDRGYIRALLCKDYQ